MTSKHITTPNLICGVFRTVYSFPGIKSPIATTIFSIKNSIFDRGTYSPKGTRCILSYLDGSSPEGDIRYALLKSLKSELPERVYDGLPKRI